MILKNKQKKLVSKALGHWWNILWHTKSCWLTLEAIVFASWIMSDGNDVISAALRPGRKKKGHYLLKDINKAALSLALYRSVCLQSIPAGAHMCTPRCQCQSRYCGCAGPPCAGSPHWDKETQAGIAPESVLQTEWTPTSSHETNISKKTKKMYEQYKAKESEPSCFHFNGRSGSTNGKLGYCVVPWG